MTEVEFGPEQSTMFLASQFVVASGSFGLSSTVNSSGCSRTMIPVKWNSRHSRLLASGHGHHRHRRHRRSRSHGPGLVDVAARGSHRGRRADLQLDSASLWSNAGAVHDNVERGSIDGQLVTRIASVDVTLDFASEQPDPDCGGVLLAGSFGSPPSPLDTIRLRPGPYA